LPGAFSYMFCYYTSVRLKLHHSGSRAATAPGGFKIFDDENIKAGQYKHSKALIFYNLRNRNKKVILIVPSYGRKRLFGMT